MSVFVTDNAAAFSPQGNGQRHRCRLWTAARQVCPRAAGLKAAASMSLPISLRTVAFILCFCSTFKNASTTFFDGRSKPFSGTGLAGIKLTLACLNRK